MQTIELTQSVGSVTSVMMSSAIIFSSSALYSGRMCTGNVHGGCMTGVGLLMSWMWYWSPGNRPILSKQSWYLFIVVALERPTCWAAHRTAGDAESLETSSTWIDMMPSS